MKRFDAVWTGAPLGLLAAAMLALAGCDAPGDRLAAGEGGAASAQTELPPEILAGLEMMFSAMDEGGDGAITRADLEARDQVITDSRTGQQYSGQEAVDFFLETFDLNGDGRVTREEVIEVMREVYAEQQGAARQP